MENFDRAREIAGNLSTPADELEALSQSEDALVRQNVAGNPNTSLEVLWKLAIEFPERVLENPNLPLLFLEIPDPIAQIPRKTLLKLFSCENCDLFYQPLLNSQHSEILLNVAMCDRTHPSILRKLVRDRGDDCGLRLAIAGNSSTPAEILQQLARYICAETRYKVALNPNTPVETLRDLGRDKSYLGYSYPYDNLPVEKFKAQRPYSIGFSRSRGWIAKGYVCGGVAKNPHAPTDTLETLATDALDCLRYAVAHNPSASLDILQQLARDFHPRVRAAAAERLS